MENYWTRIDYILELASWLFSNEYLLDNVMDLIDWAIDLLLTSPEAYKQQQETNTTNEQEEDSKSYSSGPKTDQKGVIVKAELDDDPDQAQMGSTKPKRN